MLVACGCTKLSPEIVRCWGAEDKWKPGSRYLAVCRPSEPSLYGYLLSSRDVPLANSHAGILSLGLIHVTCRTFFPRLHSEGKTKR